MIKDEQLNLETFEELYRFFSVREKDIEQEYMEVIKEFFNRIVCIENELMIINHKLQGDEIESMPLITPSYLKTLRKKDEI